MSAARQTKWWFAKRFLTPAVVGGYDLILLWDEDIGAEEFNPKRYVQIVTQHGLEISQPAVVGPVSWPITRRLPGSVLHRRSQYKWGNEQCTPQDADMPPCAAYVEGAS